MRVLDGPVVERAPERVGVPAAEQAPAAQRSRGPDELRRAQHLLGDAEGLDQVPGERPDPAAQRVDPAADLLGADDGQPAVLHEPGPVLLDDRERVQVAEQAERDLVARVLGVLHRPDLLDEGLEDQALHVCPRRVDDVVLHPGEDLARVHLVVDAALSRRATPASMCSSRKRSIASW